MTGLSLGDWILLILIETASFAVLFLIVFQVPLSDYLMRRRMRKKAQYAWKLREMYRRKYETVGKSRWHGKN